MNRRSQCIAYSDNIVLVTTNKQALEEAYTSLEHASTNLGLQVNIKKTKYMPMKKNVREGRIPKIKLNGREFETVDSFRCLGSLLTSDGNGNSRQTTHGKWVLFFFAAYLKVQKHL